MNESVVELTTYFGERDRTGGRFLADALFDLYERHEIHTSLLLRGIEGVGRHHHLHSDRLLTQSESLPAVSIAIDTRERIERALAEVSGLADHGLSTLVRAHLIASEDNEDLVAGLGEHADGAVKLGLYGGRSIRSEGQAGYVAALALLRKAGVLGASVLLGVDGTLHGERRRAKFFARNAGVPLMLLAIGDAQRIAGVLPRLTDLLDDPVATVERVEICKSDGIALAEPAAISDPPGALESARVGEQDRARLASWLKLTVHLDEQAMCDGRPLYLELVRRLAEAGAAGVTVLRGVRGFRGEREPTAERLHSLRRTAHMHVVAIDAPGKVRRWWPIVEALACSDALITSELVQAVL